MMTLAEFLEKKRLARHAKIRRILASKPGISKTALAKQVGVSRQWLYVEMSKMSKEVGK